MAKLIEIKLKTFSKNKLRDYKILAPKIYQNIEKVVEKIKGKVIVHVSATPCGGGVAEMLQSQVAIERSFGLESHWLVIKAEESFFNITKKIHNFLQGKPGFLSEKEKEIYFSTNNELKIYLFKFLKQYQAGIVVIHDPQPLPLVSIIPKTFTSFLRIHIDLSTYNPLILDFFKPFIVDYNLVIISNKDFLPAFSLVKKSKMKIIYPAIDPCSEKNNSITLAAAKKIINQYGINTNKPIISQISRFDPWKDTLGIIQAYYLAKNKIPDLQLVLAGFSEAQDDPEAVLIFKQVKKYTCGDRDIHLFYNLKQLKSISNNVFINALQTVSQVILQGSIREGFGLTITEAMWKGKPIIARINSGSSLQIKNNKNGILVNSHEEIAKAIVCLLSNNKLGDKLGGAAKLSAGQHFLIPRLVLDNFKLYLNN